MPRKRRFSPVLAIILPVISVLVLLILLNVDWNTKKRISQPQLFPIFNATDMNGDPVSSDYFMGRFTYVQIGDLNRKADLMLLEEVVTNYGHIMNLLVITKVPMNAAAWNTGAMIKLISSDDVKLRGLFGNPRFSVFYLYGPSGEFISSGDVQYGFEGSIKGIIDSNLLNRRFEIKMIMPEPGGKLEDYPWLQQIAQIALEQPNRYFLFGLFSSICEGCSSGVLIQLMKRVNYVTSGRLGTWCVLSPDYDDRDILSLTTQLSLDFPVIIADFLLGCKWRELGQAFSMSDVNGIVFIVNKQGKIIDIFGRDYTRSQEEFVQRCMDLSTEKLDEY